MTGNPSDTQKGKTLALCHAILPPSKRWNRLPVRFYMVRDRSHYIQVNRFDHTPLHPARDKGYIPPSFHHHFGRRRRSLHARARNTCAQNTIHAASLDHRDEGCSNIFSIFFNLNPNSTFLVWWGGYFFPCGFLSVSLFVLRSYFFILDLMGEIWS